MHVKSEYRRVVLGELDDTFLGLFPVVSHCTVAKIGRFTDERLVHAEGGWGIRPREDLKAFAIEASEA